MDISCRSPFCVPFQGYSSLVPTTTIVTQGVTQASANLINQDFTAALPNQKWPFTGEQSFVLKRLVPALKRIKLTQ
ncbi:MAG: hypothetical protein WA113_01420 [Desulfitobacteriaceae bacterium]